ncbi:MAG: ABC transporter ATP-binding protein [Halothiobacillus sp. 14-56-357]|jgi:phospholipid/cholesterol/gamma-HCH transport system ATP-binding protein|uniref:ABC transporter ATP-binding protein n=1 Tax=Halothiobacillus sp. 15-55-196 TaxID=1970382 RepID=UPI000BC8B986|nr:ATP-binding cassette domain-containing protein [Halothiobacillus sp. 15-55-196]OZB37491.1 MAG: ABC transporter ATP-binding protein [Halothiobacillus sp. 15-55-196]OZB57706.1 MAG: ABC transporter ATP-binding protein [Halothiobacillus sp. 14-56-357]OZB79531.1 MAG: ABC transporter ATP-binding protein [Halothiobacillus sp. 13-55-115]
MTAPSLKKTDLPPPIDLVIDAEGIINQFGSNCVHDNLDFKLERGKIVALVGGSGTGKTVLLHTLIMLRQANAGSLKLFGVDTSSASTPLRQSLRERIGVLFQGGALFTSLTVLENVLLPIKEHGHFDPHWLNDLGISKILLAGLPAESAHKLPMELSGGMVKRAALARALALDPELLVLDEPTSGLDPIGAAAFDDLVRTLSDSLGLTVLQVTHDLDSIWRGVDEVAFLGRKKVLAVGTAAELAAREEPELQAYFRGARSQAFWLAAQQEKHHSHAASPSFPSETS